MFRNRLGCLTVTTLSRGKTLCYPYGSPCPTMGPLPSRRPGPSGAMALAVVGVRLRGPILAREGALCTNTLSRLEPGDPELSRPFTSVDAEIPCFSVSGPDLGVGWKPTTHPHRPLQDLNPTLLPVETLLEEQASDQFCRHLSTLVGAHPTIDFDEFGAVGHMLPSGEFQLELPTSLA